MPKLIRKIETTIDKNYDSVIKTYIIGSNLETLKMVRLVQNLSNSEEIIKLEVSKYGLKRNIYNNEIIIIDGSEL